MKAQSEAPSVDSVIDELLNASNELNHEVRHRNDDLHLLPGDVKLAREKYIAEASAKINRLISEAYNKGYSDGRLVKPKYKVGDISGNYKITERFRMVGKNTKYKVVCTLCGAPMFRYSNKFNLKHKECGAIKND